VAVRSRGLLFLQMMLKSHARPASMGDGTRRQREWAVSGHVRKQWRSPSATPGFWGIGRHLERQLSAACARCGLRRLPRRGVSRAAGIWRIPTGGMAPISECRPSPTAATDLGVQSASGCWRRRALEDRGGVQAAMARAAEWLAQPHTCSAFKRPSRSGGRARDRGTAVESATAFGRPRAHRISGLWFDRRKASSDFANLLKNSPRYRDAVAAGADTQAYISRA